MQLFTQDNAPCAIAFMELKLVSTVSLQLGSEMVQTPVKTEREGNLGKVSVQSHTIVKQICFPNGNVLFLSLFSLFKN